MHIETRLNVTKGYKRIQISNKIWKITPIIGDLDGNRIQVHAQLSIYYHNLKHWKIIFERHRDINIYTCTTTFTLCASPTFPRLYIPRLIKIVQIYSYLVSFSSLDFRQFD